MDYVCYGGLDVMGYVFSVSNELCQREFACRTNYEQHVVVAVGGGGFDWAAGIRADVCSHRIVVHFFFVWCGL